MHSKNCSHGWNNDCILPEAFATLGSFSKSRTSQIKLCTCWPRNSKEVYRDEKALHAATYVRMSRRPSVQADPSMRR